MLHGFEMTFVDSGKGSMGRGGGGGEVGEGRGEWWPPIPAGRRQLIVSLCAKAFSFTL